MAHNGEFEKSLASGGIGKGLDVRAVGKYITCRIEKGNEFSAGGIMLPDGSGSTKAIVTSVGEGVTIDVKPGDHIFVANLTAISIWNAQMQQEEEVAVFSQEHIMGVIGS